MLRWYRIGLTFAACVVAGTAARAQGAPRSSEPKYPEQTVRLVVPFSAGP